MKRSSFLQKSTAAPDVSKLRLVIVSDAAPERNGVGAYYRDLLDHLAPTLAEVEVVSPTVEEDGRWQAGMVLPLPGDSTQKLCFPNPVSLRKVLARVRPHVVIVPTPGVYSLTGAFLAGRMNVPVLAVLHTDFDVLTDLYWRGSTGGMIANKYFELSHWYLLRVARRILVTSHELRDQTEAVRSRPVELVPTPVSAQFFSRPGTPPRGRLGRVLFAGRLAAEKNLDQVVQLARDLPWLEVSVAGDGPLREQLEKDAQSAANLHYLGWQDREGLLQQIDAHDALVLPSQVESFGTVALEAMARGRLVIVSGDCGIVNWEPLADCLLVIQDSETLAGAVSRAAALPKTEQVQLAKNAALAAREFNDFNTASWQRLLAEVAAEGR